MTPQVDRNDNTPRLAHVLGTIPVTSFIVTHSRKTLEDSRRDVLLRAQMGQLQKSEEEAEGRVSVCPRGGAECEHRTRLSDN